VSYNRRDNAGGVTVSPLQSAETSEKLPQPATGWMNQFEKNATMLKRQKTPCAD
jgi:hypothetical protein